MTYLKYLFVRFCSMSQPSSSALAPSSAVWAISVLLFCNVYFLFRVASEVLLGYNVFERDTNLFIGLGLLICCFVIVLIVIFVWSEFNQGLLEPRFREDAKMERHFRIYLIATIAAVLPFATQSILKLVLS